MSDHASGRLLGGSRAAEGEAPKHPLLSIVIVVFHDRQELVNIIQSILPFRSSAMEIVVIDGFSQDGTLEALQSFGDQVDYWVSEPDRGIYDAMNKGLRAARGRYVLHLNAGDRLLHVPWPALGQCAAEGVDVVCCRVRLDGGREFVSRTSLLSKIDNTWHHQGTFYRLAAHLGYDITYPTRSDFDHNQRLLKAGCSRTQISVIVAYHAGDGITAHDATHEEVYRSVKANYGIRYLMLAKLRFTLRDLRDAGIRLFR